MNVVLLLQDTRTLYGAEVATVRLAEGLDAAGVAVRVLLMRETRLGDGPSPLVEAFRRHVPVTELPVTGRFSRRAVAEIREFMAREQADVLHSTGYKADWHAGMASGWGRRFPNVSTVHGWLFRWNLKERLFQALNLCALRRFSRVIVLCQFYERYLRRHGLHPLQLARIPFGIRADDLVGRAEAESLWDQSGEVFTFGMLGRLSQEKNHVLLLRAAARLARRIDQSPRSWRILIAGEGPLRSALECHCRRLGLSDRVTFAGWKEPRDFFRRVHVLVQCSRVENQPMSVKEAMAWMRPVIATRAGGLPELVREGRTGWLIRNGSVRDLSNALHECLVRPEVARETGRRGREVLERDYPYAPMIEDHLGVYETAMRSPPRS